MWQTICPTRTSGIGPHHCCTLSDVLQPLRQFSITERGPLEICFERSLEKDTRWQRKELGPLSCRQMGKLCLYLWLSIDIVLAPVNPSPVYCGKAQRTASLGSARQVQHQRGKTLGWTTADGIAAWETFPQRHPLLALREHAPTASPPRAQWLFRSTVGSQCLEGTIFPILTKWRTLQWHESVWLLKK